MFYVLKCGCRWRMLPREFPSWKTVFHYFTKWLLDGIWESMNRALRQLLREKPGRDPEPSAGIVDAHSVKTTGIGGEQRGYDGGKKVRGRERLLEPVRSRLPRLSYLWMDAGYGDGATSGRSGSWA